MRQCNNIGSDAGWRSAVGRARASIAMFNLLHHKLCRHAKLDAYSYASKSRNSYRTHRGRAIMYLAQKPNREMAKKCV